MKIINVSSSLERIVLSRPYSIAYRANTDIAEIAVVKLQTENGLIGFGSATPSAQVTGESIDSCAKALSSKSLNWLIERDICDESVFSELALQLRSTPAAHAAVDMAIYDLRGKIEEKPLVELLGRVHDKLPTSITIGIKDRDSTLKEADEYLSRGFSFIKLKLRGHLEDDLLCLSELRKHLGTEPVIRVDPNQGYSIEDLSEFCRRSEEFQVEFIEQPLPVSSTSDLLSLPEELRARIALDESIQTAADAKRYEKKPRPAEIFNIKLMKCGGISEALRIAEIAEQGSIDLMWGCMDESIISISAALHAAFSCAQTRYLDLDGSFDLSRDVVSGGFSLSGGFLEPLDLPGLGVQSL